MIVSVVVCAYTLDRWDALEAAVASCVGQSRPPDEIWLVIDHNEELRERAAREIVGAQVVANRFEKGLSGARNTGVALSKGDVIAFLDDDAFGDPTWLEELIAPFEDPAVAGVGGWVEPHWEVEEPEWLPSTFYWVLGCSYRGLPGDGATIRNPIGASMALRREVFAVGGFTSGIGRVGRVPLGCEETELCIRYGVRHPEERFVLARSSIVHHRVPASRATWHYVWTRCWAEGLSKAAVSSLVGATSGLAAERRHVARAIPAELIENLRGPDRRADSAGRIGVLVGGTLVAAAGWLWGRRVFRRRPLNPAPGVIDLVNGATPSGVHDGGVAPGDATAPPGVTAGEPFVPIPIVRVDLDDVDDDAVSPGDGRRVWIEGLRDGQVVGAIEARPGPDGLAPADRQRLMDAAEGAELLDWDAVADANLVRVSVVVPTICREPERLAHTVDSLLALDYPDLEIVIVDNRPDAPPEGLADVLAGRPVRVVHERRAGVSNARNRGIAETTGTIVAFTDDDVVVDPEWVRAIALRMALSPEVDAVGGLVRPEVLDIEAQLWFEEFYGGFSKSLRRHIVSLAQPDPADPLFPYAPGRYGAGCNMAFRRTALERLGGFEPALGTGTLARGGEDLAIFLRVVLDGGVVAFEPAALVYHTHRTSVRAFHRQVFGYGVGLMAAYTSLVVREPERALAMARLLPEGVAHLFRPRANRSQSARPSYPPSTTVLQLLGMAVGPIAYVRSRLVNPPRG
jgi:glycosyltransferase involved in cell wall biosynthesis